MPTITSIALDATIAAALLGLLRSLAHCIASGRRAVEAEIRSLSSLESDSLTS